MVVSASHASGISMAITWGSERPAMVSSSTALSRAAESLTPGCINGNSFDMSSNFGDETTVCRAFIQLILPRTVLISLLWHRQRNGCASCQVGNVLVENL